MTNINERILLIIKHFCEGNKAEFARTMGESPQTINGWTKRKNGSNVINKILEKYKDINPAWLYTGEGEMLNPNKPEIQDQDGEVKVNLLNVPIAAETPKKTGYSLVDEFSEKLRALGYEPPKDDKGYKAIAIALADRVASSPISEEMVALVTKPLLDRIGLLTRQKAEAEMKVAEYEAMLAAESIKMAK